MFSFQVKVYFRHLKCDATKHTNSMCAYWRQSPSCTFSDFFPYCVLPRLQPAWVPGCMHISVHSLSCVDKCLQSCESTKTQIHRRRSAGLTESSYTQIHISGPALSKPTHKMNHHKRKRTLISCEYDPFNAYRTMQFWRCLSVCNGYVSSK